MSETHRIEALWTHLYWLTVLAEQGSYTAAASRLGVSKAAMSQRIVELESAAGITLVKRTTRSVRLTPAGQRLVEQIRHQYEQIAQSFTGTRDSEGVARGVVRVTAPVAFARQQLAPNLSAFVRENPGIQVEIEVSDRLSSLTSDGFDLAIRHSADIPETHIAWTLCATRSLLVASPAYLALKGTPEKPADLAAHDCLYYPRAIDSPVWTFDPGTGAGGEGGRISVPVSGPLSVNNSEILRDAAADDLGVALVPDFSVQTALANGKLVKVLADWTPVNAFAAQLFIVRPRTPIVSRAVSTFVTYLRTTFAKGFAV